MAIIVKMKDIISYIVSTVRWVDLSPEEQRLAQQAIQAKEAGVFFRIENRPRQDTPLVTGQSKQMAATFPVFSLIECA